MTLESYFIDEGKIHDYYDTIGLVRLNTDKGVYFMSVDVRDGFVEYILYDEKFKKQIKIYNSDENCDYEEDDDEYEEDDYINTSEIAIDGILEFELEIKDLFTINSIDTNFTREDVADWDLNWM